MMGSASLRRDRRAMTILIVVNLVLRFAWISFMHPVQEADFAWYYARAVELAHNQGYNWMGHPTAYWPIGWPFFLSLIYRLTGPSVWMGLAVNALLSTGIVALVYVLARMLFGDWRSATCAAAAYTLLPSQLVWNSVLGSEELFTLLLMMFFVVYLLGSNRAAPFRWLAIAGVIVGLACDVRPIPLAFPAFLFLYEWCTTNVKGTSQLATAMARAREAFVRAVWVGLFMLLAILPVTVRNRLAMHHFVLVSTNGGTNLWQGVHVNGGYWWSYNPYINPLVRVNNEVVKNKLGEHLAEQYILHHPWKTFLNGWVKIFDLYKDDVNANWYTFRLSPLFRPHLHAIDIMTTSVYWLLMVVSLIGVAYTCIKLDHTRRKAALLLTFIVYYTCFFFFFPAWDRFRYPLMPLFAVFAGPACVLLWHGCKRVIRPHA
ncbi:glycosyltransferase family 39 protein [Alicyclobacillus mali (ex Roth et al. 2021)]|nr:glycosyltransferase family 39 protein [Alicyclobacillus mali (ex Roth et al. 2021)]